MATREQNRARMEDAHNLAKIAALETDVSGIKTEVAGLDKRLGEFATENRQGLARLFDRIELTTKRETPWNLIFGAAGLAVTIALGFFAWANAYFGQSITFAQREAARALEVHTLTQGQLSEIRQESMTAAIERARLDERLKFSQAEIDRLRQEGQSPPRL